jgi:hypothetical protein
VDPAGEVFFLLTTPLMGDTYYSYSAKDPAFRPSVHHPPFNSIQPHHPGRAQRFRRHVDGAFLGGRVGSGLTKSLHEGLPRIIVGCELDLPGSAARHPTLGVNVLGAPCLYNDQPAGIQ